MRHVQACLIAMQKRWRKQFSPLWRSCEAVASLFMYGNHPISPFSPPRWAVKHVQASLSAIKN